MSRLIGSLLATALLLPVGVHAQEVEEEPLPIAAKVRTQAYANLSQGVAAYNQGDFLRAVDLLKKASDVALNNFRAHFYYGLASIEARRYEKAAEILHVALDLDPSHLQSHVALGDAYLYLGDLDEANASYYRAIKVRPEHAAALDGLGRVYQSQGNTEEAIRYLRRAIASNKGFAPAYTHLGDIYLAEERFQEAVLLLEEAVSIRADYAPGLNRLALAYSRLGLRTQAAATIQKAIEMQPRNAMHRSTLGELQLAEGFIDLATDSFTEALELDESLPEAHMGLAEVARRLGEYDDAILEMELALNDSRMLGSTRVRLETFLQEIRDEVETVVQLQARLDAGEATDDDYRQLAQVFAGRRLWGEAIRMADLESDSADRMERMAYFYFRAGRFREAEELYATLLDLEPLAGLALNQGVTFTLLGDDEQAETAYRNALELDPELHLATLYLANSLLRQKKDEAAIAAYVSYLDTKPFGESAERVRRILAQLAPDKVKPVENPAEEPLSLDLMPPPPPPAGQGAQS